MLVTDREKGLGFTLGRVPPAASLCFQPHVRKTITWPGLARPAYGSRAGCQASASRRVGIAGSHDVAWRGQLALCIVASYGCPNGLRRSAAPRGHGAPENWQKYLCESAFGIRLEPAGAGLDSPRTTLTGRGNRWFCDGWLWLLQANQWTVDPELRILQDVSPTSCPSTGQDGHGGFRCCRQ